MFLQQIIPELKFQSEVWKKKNSIYSNTQASNVKLMMIMTHNYTVLNATFTVPYGHTMDQHVYIHFLRKILRLKVPQMHSQVLDRVIILHNNTHPHIAT